MRKIILEAIINALKPLDFVLALWQGGSAAHDYTDEWSDLDIQVIAEDNRVEETFDILEKALSQVSPIKFKWRIPEPTWHGHSQCFYQLEGASPFLSIDFVVMKRSLPNQFIEFERHGNLIVEFDKANFIVQSNLERDKHFQKMQERVATLKMTFYFLQTFVKKELKRGYFVSAIYNYHQHTLQPLIELLGMVYRPERYDFKTKYFHRDFPPDVIARVSSLYSVSDLADLAAKQQEAESMFAETLKLVEASHFGSFRNDDPEKSNQES